MKKETCKTSYKNTFFICIKFICKYYHLDFFTFKTDKDEHMDFFNLADKLGLLMKEVKGPNISNMISTLPLPAIAQIKEEDYIYNVVIKDFDGSNFVVYHPKKKTFKIPIGSFETIFNGTVFVMIPKVDLKVNEKGLFKRFLVILKHQKRIILRIFFFSILVTIFGIVGAFYYKYLVDKIIPNSMERVLTQFTSAMIVLITFKVIFDMFRSQLLIYLGRNIDISLMLGYYEHVIDLPMNFFEKRQVGDIIARFNDAGKIRDAICSSVLTIMIDTIIAIVGGIMLYHQNRVLFGITLIPISFYGIIVIYFKKPLEDITRKTMESGSTLTSYLVSSLNGMETIKAFNSENEAKLHTEKKFLKLARNVFKKGFIGNLQSILKQYINSIFNIAIFWIGTIEVFKGRLTLGDLLTFNALLAYFTDPIINIINLQPSIQTAEVASKRVEQILDIEKEKLINIGTSKHSLKGDIIFKDVSFEYNDNNPVLKDINFNIKHGEKVAFVGESGSGKTTIVKLLMNFYNIDKGNIDINDVNIKNIDIDYLRSKIAYVSQNSFFFNDTIKKNLFMGDFFIEDSTMIEVCKMVQIHDFINSLPDKYDTIIEENGANLSGGQKQRLSIARAILKKPDIIIFDEATSSLDAITEKAIQDTMDKFTENITTIIIAHKLSNVISCDKIFVLNNGEIVEFGNHLKLLNMNGTYAALWNKQSA